MSRVLGRPPKQCHESWTVQCSDFCSFNTSARNEIRLMRDKDEYISTPPISTKRIRIYEQWLMISSGMLLVLGWCAGTASGTGTTPSTRTSRCNFIEKSYHGK
ncbi:hypothetical protein M0802_011797 [Mischocyttarus mexicanus]|nr:hypothetical protein M0802_011797 [Mischocyttarus mexicanus]